MAEPAASTGAPPPGRIAIVDDDGSVSTVASHEVGRALEEGARIASPDELHAAQTEARYGGTAGAAKAGAAGVARGLTLGGSDALATAVGGDETRQTLAGLKEANPLASTVGDIVGSAAPLLFSGGESLAARGLGVAGAAPRAAAGIGRLAERGVGALVGERASAGGRIARAIGKSAVAGAAEASLYGAGQAVDESVLGDTDLTAEQLLAHMGEGAAFGGVLGGLTHTPFALAGEGVRATGELASSGATKLRAVLEGSRTKIADTLASGRTAANDALAIAKPKIADVLDDARSGLAGGLATAKQTARDIADGTPAVIDKLDAEAEKLLPDSAKLQQLSDENAWRSTYARKKFTDEANARAGGPAAIGRTLKEVGVIRPADGTLANALSPQDILGRIEEVKPAIGKELGDYTANSAAMVKASKVAGVVDSEIDALRGIAGRENVVASLEGYRDSLLDKLGAIDAKGNFIKNHMVPVQDIRFQRIGLQDIVYNESKALDPGARVQFLRNIRNALGDIETDAVVAEGANADRIATLKRQYQHLRIAEDATDDAIVRGGSNRQIGATDYLAFIGGGGGVTGASAALMNKIARERGSAALSVFLEDLAKTRSIATSAKKLGIEAGDKVQALGQATGATARTAAAYAHIAQATEKVRKDIATGVRSFVAGAKKEAADAAEYASTGAKKIADVASTEARNVGERLGAAATQTKSSVERAANTVRKVAGNVRDARASAYANAYMTVDGYEHRRRQVEELDADPGLLTARLQKRASGLGDHAPMLAASFAMAAQRQHAAVKARMPVEPTPMGLFPFAKKAKPKRLGSSEARFMRFALAIDHPQSVIADLHEGKLSQEGVDALKEGWPSLYSDIRNEAFAAISEHAATNDPLPFDKELSLSLLLDVPTQYTRPEFVAAVQATKDAPEDAEEASKSGGKAPSRPLNIKSYPTMGEQVESDG